MAKPKRTQRATEAPTDRSPLHPCSAKIQASLRMAEKNRSPVNLHVYREVRRIREEMQQVATRTLSSLDGKDPTKGVHPAIAAYFSVHNSVSVLVEVLINAPALEELAERLEGAEETYMPSYPPMSPVTQSYFNCWASYDAALGPGRETFGTCILDLADELALSQEFRDLLGKLCASRLGLHLHEGLAGEYVVLRELVTGQTRRCLNTSGYNGAAGQLWLTRVLPPPAPEVDFCINITTPYVLRRPGQAQWLRYLERTLPRVGKPDPTSQYEDLMKYGLADDMWLEFIFEGYTGHNDGAVFLEGLPDVASSRPHSKVSEQGGFLPLR